MSKRTKRTSKASRTSLRNPPGWNNVVGLRPSQGRVPFGPRPEVFVQLRR